MSRRWAAAVAMTAAMTATAAMATMLAMPTAATAVTATALRYRTGPQGGAVAATSAELSAAVALPLALTLDAAVSVDLPADAVAAWIARGWQLAGGPGRRGHLRAVVGAGVVAPLLAPGVGVACEVAALASWRGRRWEVGVTGVAGGLVAWQRGGVPWRVPLRLELLLRRHGRRAVSLGTLAGAGVSLGAPAGAAIELRGGVVVGW